MRGVQAISSCRAAASVTECLRIAAGLAGAALAAPLLGRTLQRTVGMALTVGGTPLLVAAFALLSGGAEPQGSAAAPAAQADAWDPKVQVFGLAPT
jgi:hypothetical protein